MKLFIEQGFYFVLCKTFVTMGVSLVITIIALIYLA